MNLDVENFTPSIPQEIFNDLPDFIRTYIRHMEAIIKQQQTQIQQLQDRICDLEARLAKNSSNSSKPPTSDGLKRKPKSQRGKSDKKPGGQQGRAGKALLQVRNPDFIVTHAPENCECGSSLNEISGSCVERRQVFEIPQPKIEVTEHRVEEKKCSCCGKTIRGTFPKDVKGPVQYGEKVQALVAYFSNQHFIPVNRVCEIFEDIFGIPLSPGTCSNIDEKLFQKLEVFERGLKSYLLASQVLNFDESGIRCEKKLYWVHVSSSLSATLYTIHHKRGQEAMNKAGILPYFKGTAIHDHWFPYFAYKQVLHGLCNAHHLRELTFLHEERNEQWSKQMQDLLIFAKQEVYKYFDQGALPKEVLLQIEQTYTKIIDDGLKFHAIKPSLPKSKRGKQKQREGKNLLDRLKGKRECVLRFIYDFSVPFTNNQSEQDIRMVKLKQKISGCFRKLKRGQIFCRIRSYISTARKQGWNILNSLTATIRDSPYMLTISQHTDQNVYLQKIAV